MNLVRAVFYSPLSAVAIVVFLMVLMVGLDVKLIIITSLVVYLIGLASTILLGIPTYLILNRLNITNGIIYIFIGLLAPIIVGWITLFFGSKDYSFLSLISIVSGFLAAFCAYTFWLCAVPQEVGDKLKTTINE